MKKILLRTLLIFFISVFFIYMLLTFGKLQKWCKMYQIELFVTEEIDTNNLDKLKLEGLGKQVENVKEMINQDESKLSEYNSTGYAVWLQFQGAVGEIFNYYSYISIIIGLAISSGYFILNTSKINNILMKIILGYILPVMVFSIVYVLIFNIIFNPFMAIPDRNNNIVLFISLYTIIFLLMFIYKRKD